MPCSTYQTPEELEANRRQQRRELLAPLQDEIDVLKLELAERDAMLCGLLCSITSLDRGAITMVNPDDCVSLMDAIGHEYQDYVAQESGVDWNQVRGWWAEHQKRDERRRQDEAAAQEARRQEIIQRLTPEERKILGL